MICFFSSSFFASPQNIFKFQAATTMLNLFWKGFARNTRWTRIHRVIVLPVLYLTDQSVRPTEVRLCLNRISRVFERFNFLSYAYWIMKISSEWEYSFTYSETHANLTFIFMKLQNQVINLNLKSIQKHSNSLRSFYFLLTNSL